MSNSASVFKDRDQTQARNSGIAEDHDAVAAECRGRGILLSSAMNCAAEGPVRFCNMLLLLLASLTAATNSLTVMQGAAATGVDTTSQQTTAIRMARIPPSQGWNVERTDWG